MFKTEMSYWTFNNKILIFSLFISLSGKGIAQDSLVRFAMEKVFSDSSMSEWMSIKAPYNVIHVVNLMPSNFNSLDNVDSLYKDHFLLRAQRGLPLTDLLNDTLSIVYNRLGGWWGKTDLPMYFFTQECKFDSKRIQISLKIYSDLSGSQPTGKVNCKCFELVFDELDANWRISLLKDWEDDLPLELDYGVLLDKLYTPCSCF